MKSQRLILFGLVSLLSGQLFIGCTNTEYGNTSPYHPGPVVGKTVGNAAGVAAGNVVGAGVGVVEGAAVGAAAPFDPSYHMVRHWRTETTSDGRTIQVPYDVLVDKYGRPVPMPAPTGNPAPPPAAPVSTNAPAQ
ncbi:MAG TPA: flagellar motor protein MotB [Verrucomicrobiae bacterium]|nr:flagellar motor protein MotB [Verrucomicrobiae bacterium]